MGEHWSDIEFRKLKERGYTYGFRTHIPNFVDGVDSTFTGFNILSELWEIESVKQWATTHSVGIMEPYTKYQHLVMAFRLGDGERDYWVIGYFCNLKESYNEQT